MKYQEYKIEKDYSSIYIFLKQHGFSENYAKNLRKSWGNLVINGEMVNISHNLCKGDLLQLNSSPNSKTAIERCRLPLDIVYEDEYYLLINKPSGLPCMPSRSHYKHNLSGAILNYMSDKEEDFVVRIINRLDKDTAGIIIVAKDSISQKEIKDIRKTYHAICCGKIDSPIKINSPIKTICENGRNQHKRIIAPDGQTATTYGTPISHSESLSHISLTLEHGRTHQIRVHLSSIGHPLLGDELYGEKSDLISHTALICKKISFLHPYLNKSLSFEIALPEDFKTVLAQI